MTPWEAREAWKLRLKEQWLSILFWLSLAVITVLIMGALTNGWGLGYRYDIN